MVFAYKFAETNTIKLMPSSNLSIASRVLTSSQIANLNKMQVINNNSANATTPGFQSDKVVFIPKDYPISETENVALVSDIGQYKNLEQGNMRITGSMLDFAINGDGYFAVNTPFGVHYTRDGNFSLSREGVLVMASNEQYQVLDGGGQPITIPTGANIVALGDGTLLSEGDAIGQIGVVSFVNPQSLSKSIGGLLRTNEQPTPATRFSLKQGMLEESNVNMIDNMVESMGVNRAVAANANLIEEVSDLQSKAITVFTNRN